MNWPTVIAEIGINHEGNLGKAYDMIDAALSTGCKCVKFQCHVIEDEYSAEGKNALPPNAGGESIYSIMERCAFDDWQEQSIKGYVEYYGMQYLCTPFSRAAADRLERLGVTMYKIGSGEMNNLPLVKHINAFGKPVILSTGMNSLESIHRTVDLLTVPFALLHCVSMYPTPYNAVHLGAIAELKREFPGVTIGLSDHSQGIYTALAGVALGAEIIEKHFTIDRNWPGPDNPISIEPNELRQLVEGYRAIREALPGGKAVQEGEQGTIDFAYASVVSLRNIKAGELLDEENIWVKRPGGGIPASWYEVVLNRFAAQDIQADTQLKMDDVLWNV